MRRCLALVITCVLTLAVPASAGGPNHVVTASPTADGAKQERAHVQVATTGADDVTSTNLARATPSSCTGCEGIAVAFQAVIVKGDPDTVSPTNAAVAVNSDCTSCKAFAFAYQYVVTADASGLDDEGRDAVKEIRDEADRLVDSGLPYDQLDAQLKDLAARFRAAVAENLRERGAKPQDDRARVRTDQAGT